MGPSSFAGGCASAGNPCRYSRRLETTIIRMPLVECLLDFKTILFTGGRKQFAFVGRIIEFKVLRLLDVSGSRVPVLGRRMNSGGIDVLNSGVDVAVLFIEILLLSFLNWPIRRGHDGSLMEIPWGLFQALTLAC